MKNTLNNTRTLCALGLIVALVTQTGCFTAMALVKQKQEKEALEASQAKFQKDLEKGDVEMLDGACTSYTYEKRRLSSDERKQACEKLSAALTERMSTLECDRTADAWQAVKRGNFAPKEPVFNALGERAVACDQWSFLFNDLFMASHSTLKGKEMMAKMATTHDLEAKYFEVANAKTISNSASSRFIDWRLQQDTPVDCTKYTALPTDSKVTQSHVLRALKSADTCKEDSITLSMEMLMSADKFAREFACKTLGQVGREEHQEKIGTVAAYDKEWDVRRECDAAWGQIKLRAQ